MWGWANITKALLLSGFVVIHRWGKEYNLRLEIIKSKTSKSFRLIRSFVLMNPWRFLKMPLILRVATPDYKTVHPKTRKQWRQWLKKNHLTSPGIWIIYFKKQSGKPRVSYDEAVEEALCFGWIDSLPRKLDDERAMLKFTPRKPKSVWSDLNKARVEKLITQKQMTSAGLAKIEQAKKDGSWNLLNASNYHTDNNSLPDDLQKAFSKNKKSFENFNAFPSSYRRRFLFWIDSAKRTETRTARIKQTVLMAAVNKKPGLKGFKL